MSLPTFHIVQNYEDLISQQIIPRKVLGGMMPYYMGGPMIQPMPITKSPSLEVQMSPISPALFSPGSGVSLTRMSPSGPVITPIQTYPLNSVYPRRLGAPIIKMSPLLRQGTPATIKIISPSGSTYNLRIPLKYIRNITDDIYYNEVTDNNMANLMTFRIITPTIDSNVRTTPGQMLKIIRKIQSNYPTVTYLRDDGTYGDISLLLNSLSTKYHDL